MFIETQTESIVDNDENPTGEDIYYVAQDTCTECIGDHDTPACAEACPTEGCIVWSDAPTTEGAVAGEPCIEE
ncbi:MAG: ferredoxin [Campylobacterota bacterium]|nr:ferredoxin [Campylobacterota bacterium]